MSAIDFNRLPQPFAADHPGWIEIYDFAWRLASSHIRTRNGRAYMDAAWDPTRNYQWVWDTCFMSLYCRYAPDQFPGVQSLDNFYELQTPDGYISMTYCLDANREVWPNRINPPLFAWAEWEYYRSTGDASRFERIIPHVEKLMGWIDAHRRTEPHRRRSAVDGTQEGRGESVNNFQLYYFRDAGSSGMDDSPRAPRMDEAGQFFDWIDLSCQMVLSFNCLARMLTVLGRTTDAEKWTRRAQETGDLINTELWSDRSRFYHDRMLPTNFVASKTIAGFWPILAECCPKDRLRLLVDHLNNPAEFNRPIPIPSLSADDPNYDPEGTYWVAGVWAPTNYMVTRGLQLAGEGNLAHSIARRYVDGLLRTFKNFTPATLWECYCPETDRPGLHPYRDHLYARPDFVGWSGLGPIAMLIENLIGLDADVPARQITWTVRLTEEHGIRNFNLGSLGHADFRIEKRVSAADPIRGSVRADQAFTLTLVAGTRNAQIAVQPGKPVEFKMS
jgi:glycogen debranching enzyme